MSFRLPDIHNGWTFPIFNNPYYPEVAQESMQWVESFKIFPEDRQKSFRAIMPGLLASMAYPTLSREHFRAACDLIAVLYVVDEVSDYLSPEETKALTEQAAEAIRNPAKGRSTAEHPLVSLHRRTAKTASDTSNRRFVKSYEEFLFSMTQEAKDRQNRSVSKSMDDYLALRRSTGAIKPSFDLLLLPFEISDEVLDLPVVKELEVIAIELIAVANDIFSYNVEQARGDIHNLIVVLMEGDEKLTLQMAMDIAGDWYRERSYDFLECLKRLPVVEPGDQDILHLHQYARGLGTWVTANYQWSFGCGRFFGDRSQEVRESGIVELLPQQV
ncbi:hypothetical protein NP233_g6248 [Leucocoprinus birnbaumii]|uniref:Terpene synthase n=1 Tax=Leucocoprinus birnbaumii TaxID=56174 RepID=A0AAD5VRC8_9AGAR|nr:hypothetical protein NP233_g6248 [Leucocoprinus birnbaumii]